MQDMMGCSALIAACLDGFVDVARVLLEHGAIIDYQDKVSMILHTMYNHETLVTLKDVIILSRACIKEEVC